MKYLTDTKRDTNTLSLKNKLPTSFPKKISRKLQKLIKRKKIKITYTYVYKNITAALFATVEIYRSLVGIWLSK